MSNVNTYSITRVITNPSLVAQDPKRKLNDEVAMGSAQLAVKQIDDLVTIEEPLEIWLKHPLLNNGNAKLLLTTMRSPGDDIALVKGWIHSSGLLQQFTDIQSVTHTGSQRIKGQQGNQVLISLQPHSTFDFASTQSQAANHIDYVNSACSVCGQRSIDVLLDKLPPSGVNTNTSEISISVQSIFELANALKKAQSGFALTGGSHGAGLFSLDNRTGSGPKLLAVREDIGRHNALDKLIGAHLSQLSHLRESVSESNTKREYGIILSSRISFDLVQKAAMANISFILAMGAPSSLAIELAKECDICLIGFIQPQRINIYTSEQRVDKRI